MQGRTRKLVFSPSEILLIVALIAFFALTALHAHAQVVGGTLSGLITDPTGAALSDASVLVHNDETGNERRLTTGADGRFSAPSIPIGTYTITAEHPGFTAQRRIGIPLTIGQSKQIDLELTVDSVKHRRGHPVSRQRLDTANSGAHRRASD
jgi:Carboxypeptidase regulatory-like domain